MRIVLGLLVAATAPIVAYSNVAVTRLEATAHSTKPKATTAHSTKPSTNGADKFPSLKIKAAYGIENEYQLNLGKSIDSLRRDYPHIFHTAPDFSIFTENILLTGAASKHSLEGIERYTRVFDVLRFIRNTTMVHDEIGARLVVSDGKIRVRWNAKLTMSAPFSALPGLARDASGRPMVFVDGVSVYDVNAKGHLSKHTLEDIVVTPPELQGAVDLALFAWPGGFSPPVPVPAVAPFLAQGSSLEVAVSGAGSLGQRPPVSASVVSRVDDLALSQLAPPGTSRVAGTLGRPSSRQRTPVPVAMARESPMERAARERAEDAEQAQRLRELRASPASAGARKGVGSVFTSFLQPPQTCESNYDCEDPLVCCDFVVASICCSSGMMIGPPQNAGLQRQAIPIPVRVDDGGSPGGLPPPSSGGGLYGAGSMR